jgi:hypothetical protein
MTSFSPLGNPSRHTPNIDRSRLKRGVGEKRNEGFRMQTSGLETWRKEKVLILEAVLVLGFKVEIRKRTGYSRRLTRRASKDQ